MWITGEGYAALSARCGRPVALTRGHVAGRRRHRPVTPIVRTSISAAWGRAARCAGRVRRDHRFDMVATLVLQGSKSNRGAGVRRSDA
jgi:hypothetical protein